MASQRVIVQKQKADVDLCLSPLLRSACRVVGLLVMVTFTALSWVAVLCLNDIKSVATATTFAVARCVVRAICFGAKKPVCDSRLLGWHLTGLARATHSLYSFVFRRCGGSICAWFVLNFNAGLVRIPRTVVTASYLLYLRCTRGILTRWSSRRQRSALENGHQQTQPITNGKAACREQTACLPTTIVSFFVCAFSSFHHPPPPPPTPPLIFSVVSNVPRSSFR